MPKSCSVVLGRPGRFDSSALTFCCPRRNSRLASHFFFHIAVHQYIVSNQKRISFKELLDPYQSVLQETFHRLRSPWAESFWALPSGAIRDRHHGVSSVCFFKPKPNWVTKSITKIPIIYPLFHLLAHDLVENGIQHVENWGRVNIVHTLRSQRCAILI